MQRLQEEVVSTAEVCIFYFSKILILLELKALLSFKRNAENCAKIEVFI